MKKPCAKASRKEQGRPLDEMGAVTGCDREYLIRRLGRFQRRRPRRGRRGCRDGPQVDDALWVISETLDDICAERLTPNLVWMAEHLTKHSEMVADEPLPAQLGQISVAVHAPGSGPWPGLSP